LDFPADDMMCPSPVYYSIRRVAGRRWIPARAGTGCGHSGSRRERGGRSIAGRARAGW
jgi:hypothetical protein